MVGTMVAEANVPQLSKSHKLISSSSYRAVVRGSPRTTCALLLPFSKLAADFALAASLI